MELFKNLGLEHWWNILIYLGVSLIASTFIFDIDFLEKKHLFGLGIGLFIIGLSHNIAFKHLVIPDAGGYWKTKEIIHNWFTKLLFVLGSLITSLFFILILIQLLK